MGRYKQWDVVGSAHQLGRGFPAVLKEDAAKHGSSGSKKTVSG